MQAQEGCQTGDVSDQLEQSRRAVQLVPLVRQLQTAAAWQVFMQHHVFAVWDFMNLLKRLQHEVCGTGLPWCPPKDVQAARFVNEMVLAEETDEDGQGGYVSHFALYRAAMREAGADTGPIDAFVAALRAGQPWAQALDRAGAPPAAATFVRHTLQLALHGTAHEVAAAFLYGREALLPDLFAVLLDRVAADHPGFAALQRYFSRHVELDGDQHGPMAAQLLRRLCGSDRAKAAAATQAAQAALQARRALWAGIAEAAAAVQEDACRTPSPPMN